MTRLTAQALENIGGPWDTDNTAMRDNEGTKGALWLVDSYSGVVVAYPWELWS